jgi:beta-lactamase regulating signal transducer with metallopeptidase domain
MTVAERLLHVLLVQTLTLTLAVLAVRALQLSVGRRFGAASAYLCWLLVPVALLAVALPRPAAQSLVVRVDVAAVAPVLARLPAVSVPAWSQAREVVVVAGWAIGALLLAAALMQRQRRFERLLTPSRAGAPACLPAGSGPAVLGVWTRRIVLPRDFDTTFDAEERRLMLLHEGVHLRRGDNAWNLLASALLVLHWFNPVAWWAWRRLRVDQEMSCDADVLRRESPGALAAYAGALLKVQGVALAPPLATSWQSVHPLVERVRMLSLHRISPARHRAGIRVAALAVVVAGIGGYVLRAGATTAADAAVMTTVDLRVDSGAAIHAELVVPPGQTATLRQDPDARNALTAPVEIAYSVTRLDNDRLQLDTTLRQGTPLVTIGTPRLVVRDGDEAKLRIKTGDGAHEVAVSFVPRTMSVPMPPLPPLPALRALPPVGKLPPVPAVPPIGSVPPVPSVDDVPPVPTIGAVPAPPAIQRAL